MNVEEIQVPNRNYLELTYVGDTATGRGLNQRLIMKADESDTFTVTEGRINKRVGRNCKKTYRLAMEEWSNFYKNKIAHGWLLIKTEEMKKKEISRKGLSLDGGNYASTGIYSVDAIITKLLSYVNRVIDSNYTTTIEDISDEMLTFAEAILADLSANYETMSIAEFNGKLKKLFAAIPRRIDILANQLAKRKVEFPEIIDRELDLFNIIKSQVRDLNVKEEVLPTVPDKFGLKWEPVSSEEADKIRAMMGDQKGRYRNAWKISNKKTSEAFDKYCEMENLTEENGGISHLFHGSRPENFWSIITNGLTINPIGVVTNGKMFGLGTYFANLARKSMGYTGTASAYWAKGSETVGYLGIFKVATGKHYDVESAESDLTYNVLQKRCPGAHCTWAHAGKSLRNDEIIVYQDQQSTIEYLVEFA